MNQECVTLLQSSRGQPNCDTSQNPDHVKDEKKREFVNSSLVFDL